MHPPISRTAPNTTISSFHKRNLDLIGQPLRPAPGARRPGLQPAELNRDIVQLERFARRFTSNYSRNASPCVSYLLFFQGKGNKTAPI